MEFDLENPLSHFNDSCPATSSTLPSLFLVESDHMPSQNYIQALKAGDLDIAVRQEAIASISQFSCEFEPFLSYLAVNYLDRFLSSQGIPEQPKTWVLRLLAISCVSLAAKMKKTEFSLTDFQGDGSFIFDEQSIERMEYLILGALKWRMRSITPFSFISFFISFFKLKDRPLRQALKARAVEIIFKAQMDIKLLEFKPSVIAASALLSASHEFFPLQFPCFRKAISSCSYVNKENLLKCYNSMQEMEKEGYQSIFDMVSSSKTPINVLDQHFSSSEIEITTNGIDTTATTTTVTLLTENDIKRRRINDHRDNHSVLLSQVQHC